MTVTQCRQKIRVSTPQNSEAVSIVRLCGHDDYVKYRRGFKLRRYLYEVMIANYNSSRRCRSLAGRAHTSSVTFLRAARVDFGFGVLPFT